MPFRFFQSAKLQTELDGTVRIFSINTGFETRAGTHPPLVPPKSFDLALAVETISNKKWTTEEDLLKACFFEMDGLMAPDFRLFRVDIRDELARERASFDGKDFIFAKMLRTKVVLRGHVKLFDVELWGRSKLIFSQTLDPLKAADEAALIKAIQAGAKLADLGVVLHDPLQNVAWAEIESTPTPTETRIEI